MRTIYACNVEDVADTILYLSGCCITPKKLQKLLFISYGMYLVTENEMYTENSKRLFKNEFQAWAHGPVIPRIYRKYKHYGMNPICASPTYEPKIESGIIKFLEKILMVFGEYQAYQLEKFTHSQYAWQHAREGINDFGICTKKISDKDIFESYIKYVS